MGRRLKVNIAWDVLAFSSVYELTTAVSTHLLTGLPPSSSMCRSNAARFTVLVSKVTALKSLFVFSLTTSW